MAANSGDFQLPGTDEPALEIEKEPVRIRAVLPNSLSDDLKPRYLNRGVLIPLKTTQEVRQDHTIVQAFITRAPTKSANDVITLVTPLNPLAFLCPLSRQSTAHHKIQARCRTVVWQAFLTNHLQGASRDAT